LGQSLDDVALKGDIGGIETRPGEHVAEDYAVGTACKAGDVIAVISAEVKALMLARHSIDGDVQHGQVYVP
jgi:hypothetical protein